MFRALVAAGFLSLLAVAGAFGVPAPHPPSAAATDVVAQSARTWSESEIIQMVEGGTVRLSPGVLASAILVLSLVLPPL
jgi:hypothetical protein